MSETPTLAPAESAKAAKRFNQLSPGVRKLLADLDDDDVAAFKRAIKLFRAMQGWCRVNRWLFLGALALLIMLAQGIEAMQKIVGLKH